MKPAFALLAPLALGACASAQTAPLPAAAPIASPEDASVAAERIKPFQYLYGSAEAGALSIQTWHALVDFARERVARRPGDSVVLAEGSTLAEPHFVPCGNKPFAAVFDVDETVILNLGLEAKAAAGESLGGGALGRWSQTDLSGMLPLNQPGKVQALDVQQAPDGSIAVAMAIAPWGSGGGPTLHVAVGIPNSLDEAGWVETMRAMEPRHVPEVQDDVTRIAFGLLRRLVLSFMDLAHGRASS